MAAETTAEKIAETIDGTTPETIPEIAGAAENLVENPTENAAENPTPSIKHRNLAYWTDRARGYSDVNQVELNGAQRRVWANYLQRRISQHFADHAASRSASQAGGTTQAAHAHEPQDIRVLDIGCGPGFFSIILAELGYTVTGIDLTPAMLDQARANAGDIASRITFMQGDAENLLFDDNTFDVVVSRNLTWDLPHPERAYAEWARVLAPGGLMLNFDANWYRYLFDDDLRQGYERDREATAQAGVKDEYTCTDIDAMEAIAREVPMSSTDRPAWDLRVLRNLDLSSVEADENAWHDVWSVEERVNFASTPLFCVSACKPLADKPADKSD